MNPAVAIFLGAAFGGGLWALAAGLRPRRPALDRALARLSGEDASNDMTGLAQRLGLPEPAGGG
jgi:hypothetical protein